MVWQSSMQVQRCLLPLGYSGLGQVASNPTTLVFAWLVALSGYPGLAGMAHVVLGVHPWKHHIFHPCFPTRTDFPDTEFDRICFQTTFLRVKSGA